MRKYNSILFVAIVVSMMTIFTPSYLFALVETGGIGIKVAQLYNRTTGVSNHRGSLVVLDVFRHSAAERAGMEKGDVILKVDDVLTGGSRFLLGVANNVENVGGKARDALKLFVHGSNSNPLPCRAERSLKKVRNSTFSWV